MIELETSRDLLPESVLKSWDSDDKDLTYVTGVWCVVPETLGELSQIVAELMDNRHRVIGFDTESTSTRPESARIVGMSFAYEEMRGFYVPVGHTVAGQNLPLEETLQAVRPVLQQPRLSMAGGKFDWHLMKRHGVDISWGIDSQVMSRLLGEVEYGVGLKRSVERMFGERMIEFTDVVKPAAIKKGESFADILVTLAALYAVPDAIYTRRVSQYALRNMPDAIKKFLLKIEHEVMRIAGEMEYTGLPLDEEFLDRHIEAGKAMVETLYHETIEGLRAVARRRGRDPEEIPEDLNMNSAPQIRSALFDVCGFTPVKRSKKTGEPSADKQSIEIMAERDPEVDWLRRYRSAESRVGDLEELRDYALSERGWLWIHGSLNPTGAATGRWSSSGPNLQNIPKTATVYESRRSRWEVMVRDAIKAPPGHYIVTADYSQIELRVAAGESQCRAWIDAFANGDDVHAASGAAIHGVPISEVTKAQRADGKTFNFALLFGQEVKSTAQQLGRSVAEAKRMQDAFWSGLPEVKSWIDRVHAFVRQHHYVETKFGRRRWLRGITSDNKWIYLQNLRESVNTIVQGTAADVLKIGMTRAEDEWKRLGARLFLVVHDQYVWLVPEETAPGEFCRTMDQVINFEIPGYPAMVSDYGIGERFGTLREFESAAAVPDTWEEVFAGGRRSSAEEKVLYVEVADIDIEGLTQLTKLITTNPGNREVVLRVTNRGLERTLAERTNLGLDAEMAIRAAIGAAARVSLV